MKSLFIFLLLPVILSAPKNYPAIIDSFMKGEVSINSFNGNVLVALFQVKYCQGTTWCN
jgi:hypothetical protein